LPSGGRALGLSDRGALQEILEFSLDMPPLGGGWLRHRSEQYCRCSQILADPAGGRGQPYPGIVSDTALDVPSLMTRFSGECSVCPLLLDVLSELHKLSCFLIELGLHLVDLLELCPDPPQGLGQQLAPAGCQREAQAQGDRHPPAYQCGCLRRDPLDRRGNIRYLGHNPRRHGCGHHRSNQRGSSHMRS
jgi:hypothetical protein